MVEDDIVRMPLGVDDVGRSGGVEVDERIPGPDWWLADDGNYYPPPRPDLAPPPLAADPGLPRLQLPPVTDPSAPSVAMAPPPSSPMAPPASPMAPPGSPTATPPQPSGWGPQQGHTSNPATAQPLWGPTQAPTPGASQGWGSPGATSNGWTRPTAAAPPPDPTLAQRLGCGARIRGVLVGILWIALGIAITAGTAALGFRIFVVSYGPMVYGIYVILRSMFSRNP